METSYLYIDTHAFDSIYIENIAVDCKSSCQQLSQLIPN